MKNIMAKAVVVSRSAKDGLSSCLLGATPSRSSWTCLRPQEGLEACTRVNEVKEVGTVVKWVLVGDMLRAFMTIILMGMAEMLQGR